MPYDYDPELAAGLPMMPTLLLDDVVTMRQATLELEAKMEDFIDRTGVSTREVRVPTTHAGEHELVLRVHTPEDQTEPLPLVYDMHGGGFCIGSASFSDARAVQMVRDVPAVVVSIDYRLAPEHPYPVPLEDSYHGLVWAGEHADELGIDASRIAVYGHSAGGNLAAALCLLARDRGGPHIDFQYLGIPTVDDRGDTASRTTYEDTAVLDRKNTALAWQHYLGDIHGSDDVPAYAAPIRAEALAGLPPAYVSVMQFDPVRDEGIAYATKLAQAGVPTELHLFPATFHGSSMLPMARVSRREYAEEAAVLRRALHG
ncbi:alpha/beta hydrolase [Nocardia vinacea]|uniref:Alpha/beta hydrolase n=1 Tax=Nocardia vinacea TaxID=96468 RepID=A0ABZ1YLR2_9NOCA|nr:alpha/beta hydrolase [Nocardia vinacea]